MAFYKCIGNSGSQPVLVTKTITQNGTYNASSDSADGYSQVIVNVGSGGLNSTQIIVNTGTYTIN